MSRRWGLLIHLAAFLETVLGRFGLPRFVTLSSLITLLLFTASAFFLK